MEGLLIQRLDLGPPSSLSFARADHLAASPAETPARRCVALRARDRGGAVSHPVGHAGFFSRDRELSTSPRGCLEFATALISMRCERLMVKDSIDSFFRLRLVHFSSE